MTIIYVLGAWLAASFPLSILIGRSFDRAGVSVDACALGTRAPSDDQFMRRGAGATLSTARSAAN